VTADRGRRVGLATVLRRAQWPLWLAAGLAAETVLWRGGSSADYIVYDVFVCMVSVSVALAVWETDPANRIGPLLLVWTGWNLISPVRFLPNTVVICVSWLVNAVTAAVFAWLILAYPDGRLHTRTDRAFVVGAFAWSGSLALLELLVAPPESLFGSCVRGPCPTRPPLLRADPEMFDTMQTVQTVGDLLLVTGFIALAVRHAMRAGPTLRHRVRPMVATGVLLAVGFVVQALWPADTVASWTVSDLIDHVSILLVTVAFLGHLYASRTERSVVADSLAELASAPPGAVQPLLRRVLRDPDVRLGRWNPDHHRYLDDAGEPVRTDAPDVVARHIDTPSGPLAVLVQRTGLVHDERTMTSVLAAVRLALDNQQLHEQVQARLDEVRGSRARLVDAEDRARQRLERDLHDGAQQRLLSIGLALQLARAETDGSGSAAELIEQAQHELHHAIDDLRDLAQGIHPSVLIDHGFTPAVRALAERVMLPVHVTDHVQARLPRVIEVTMYFLVCEALQNTVKHAHARQAWVDVERGPAGVRLQVRDDGDGGAQPELGSGLRGMRDRVEAIDGSLTVDSPLGGGTTIVAHLPCG
jgi:signal transduction histidine kinase